jgi:hypothetical protein
MPSEHVRSMEDAGFSPARHGNKGATVPLWLAFWLTMPSLLREGLHCLGFHLAWIGRDTDYRSMVVVLAWMYSTSCGDNLSALSGPVDKPLR